MFKKFTNGCVHVMGKYLPDPFAFPALGIAGLSAKDIMGYCVVTLLFSGGVAVTGLLLF